MRSPPAGFFRRLPLWLAAVLFCPLAALHAADEPVAVFSQVFNGYQRTRLPDNSFKPETYAFGEGGRTDRGVKDPGLDGLSFNQIIRTVAGPLERLNYRPSAKPADTDLLILVFWGATRGSRDSDPSDASGQVAAAAAAGAGGRDELDSALGLLSLANAERDRLDDRNARILGYTDSLDHARFAQQIGFDHDVLEEIGASRYFVVLQAYDFRTAAKYKKLKPLWTARISIGEQGVDFAATLEQMVRVAAPYFGRASHGLQRDVAPEGHVRLGETKILETLPNRK